MKKIFTYIGNQIIKLFKAMMRLIKRVLSTIIFFFGAWYSIYVFFIMNQVTIKGRKNIPHKTRVLFVSNHATFIDSFLIGMAIINVEDFFFNYRRIPWNAAAAEFFFSNPVKKFIFDLLKCKPMVRKTTSLPAFEKSVREMVTVLNTGNLVLFFEGGRTRNGETGECKSGAPVIIRLAKPIVIPIYLDNIGAIMPVEAEPATNKLTLNQIPNGQPNMKKTKKKLNLLKIRTGISVGVFIGEPIDFSDIPQLDIDLDKIINSKENFPTAVYSKPEIEIIKARIYEKVEELNPKKNGLHKTD